MYDPTDVFARDTWVRLVRVSETGRAWLTIARTTPPTPEVTTWWLGFSMAWNPVNREYALPVVSTDDPTERLFSGAINIQRIGQGSLCMEGEPPREISAPGSGSPLTVSVQIDWARFDHPRRVYVHFEDIGAEATVYNAFTLGYWTRLPVPIGLSAVGEREPGRALALTRRQRIGAARHPAIPHSGFLPSPSSHHRTPVAAVELNIRFREAIGAPVAGAPVERGVDVTKRLHYGSNMVPCHRSTPARRSDDHSHAEEHPRRTP